MYCHSCGQQNPSGSFCTQCGQRLAVTTTTPPTTMGVTPSPASAPPNPSPPIPVPSPVSSHQPRRISAGAITGIVLGSVGVIALGVFAAVTIGAEAQQEAEAPRAASVEPAPPSEPSLGQLWVACNDGDFEACDELYRQAPEGSEYYTFGDTCGNRNEPSGWCVELYAESASTTASAGQYGSDYTLDLLWDGCFAGDFQACDDLFLAAPYGTEYSDFGDSCGNRNEPSGYCVNIYGNSSSGAGSGEYGSDPVLDYLWDWCSDGDWASCDALWQDAPSGSTYEYFGDTCGLRNEPAGWCMDIYG